jgi:release factor glutamine methyltransferase
MNRLRHQLARGAARLAAALALEPATARIEASALLGHVLGKPRAWLIAHDDEALPADAAARFSTLLSRREAGEPVAYLVGEREFHGLAFIVTPAVLIPRPETELLAELALARLPGHTAARVLDLGTGSGALAVTLAKWRPTARVTALDASLAALDVARQNAGRHGVANVRFQHSDWFSALTGEIFELVVANPPYVAAEDAHLKCGDVRFEPLAALAAGQDGLDAIRRIVGEAPSHLAPAGALLIEHGWDQAARCRALFDAAGFIEVQSARDLAGIERVTLGRRP